MAYYTGDYYTGDYYAIRAGDPFLGGLVKGIGRVAKGAAGIVGKVVKRVAKGVPGLGTAITIAEGVHSVIKGVQGSRRQSQLERAGGGGMQPVFIDVPQAGGGVAGGGGAAFRIGGKKYRTMNYGNGKAAKRAIRRLSGTHRLLSGIEKAARRAIPVQRSCKCSTKARGK